MASVVDRLTSTAVSWVRLGAGGRVLARGARPARTLELYEFEACPFCRRVREALSALDLEVNVHPCPKGGPNGRRFVEQRGGKAQFPFLIDPNTGREMYESGDIVAYLFEQYGEGGVPLRLLPGPLGLATAMLAGVPRPGRGAFYRDARRPAVPLQLFGFESSPDSRLVREALCELELPYRLTNVAPGSAHAQTLAERSKGRGAPFLIDPNTGAERGPDDDIVGYLRDTYTGAERAAAGTVAAASGA